MSKSTVIDGIDYGPLAGLIGTWEGDKGMDIAPEPDGVEESPYFETITFEAGGDLTNANEQKLVIVIYHQVVSRKSDGKVFHHQMGYWNWDAATGVIMQSVTIPRAVTLIAGGTYPLQKEYAGAITLNVCAAENSGWGIAQSPYMAEKAKTLFFEHSITVDRDRMSYFETTRLDIYGKKFDHTDGNNLLRVK
ncbi:MAG TPA: heme-binding beta-barrel domain-containing protein [Spongiibacteraceae bacterium]|nr:heme-binding beta-barrel domain-containing protein [Spongiibacteraceae bacterium]